MNNERSLFPPLFRKVDTGGGSEIREKIAEIDSEITDISTDITNIDSAITRLSNNVGNLSNLDTTDKSSLVGAVNEVASAGGGSVSYSTTEQKIGKVGNDDLYAISFFNATTSDIVPNFSHLYYLGGVASKQGYGHFTLNNGLGTALRADVRAVPNSALLITAESGVSIDIVTLHYTK